VKKVKIIFDNNLSITGDGQPLSSIFSASISRLNKFIIQNKLEKRVIICLTETFKQEGIAELQTRALSKYQSGINSIKLLEGILEDTTITKIENKELFKVIENKFNEKISEFNIEILPLPLKTSILDLSERAISYKAPFEKGDKGFKDTLAWLSIIEDSEKNTDFEYILITEDKIFSNDSIKKEFTNENKKDIIIIPADPIEEILDEMLNLGFNLEKIKKEVIDKIKEDDNFKNQLEKRALKELSTSNNRLSFFVRPYSLSPYDPEWKSKIVNLIYEDVGANVKNNISKDLFEVEINVTFIPKYADLDKKKLRRGALSSNIFAAVSDEAVSRYDFNDNAVSVMYGHNNNLYPELLRQKFTLKYSKISGLKITDSEEVMPNNRLGYLTIGEY